MKTPELNPEWERLMDEIMRKSLLIWLVCQRYPAFSMKFKDGCTPEVYALTDIQYAQ